MNALRWGKYVLFAHAREPKMNHNAEERTPSATKIVRRTCSRKTYSVSTVQKGNEIKKKSETEKETNIITIIKKRIKFRRKRKCCQFEIYISAKSVSKIETLPNYMIIFSLSFLGSFFLFFLNFIQFEAKLKRSWEAANSACPRAILK